MSVLAPTTLCHCHCPLVVAEQRGCQSPPSGVAYVTVGSNSLKDARSQLYSSLINENPGNSTLLFSTINRLLKPQPSSSTEATEEQCHSFIDFFRSNVNSICSVMSSSPSLLPSDTNTLSTSVLSPLHLAKVQESHVEEIVRKMKSCTCTLDPIPTALLKSHIPTRSPFITKVVNLSLQSGCVPPALKVAVIRPLLKKPTLDAEVLANYRLISILAFLSKVLEKVIASQLKDNLKHNILYEQFQSGFCSAHSTETAGCSG